MTSPAGAVRPRHALLRIVLYAEAARWSAYALECDLRTSAKTADAALDTLIKIVETHIAADLRTGREPLSIFKVTPQGIWNKFATAANVKHPVELRRAGSPGRLRYLVATCADDTDAAIPTIN